MTIDAAWLDSVVELVSGPSFCAGVAVGPDEVATAYHCVASGLRVKVATHDGRTALGRTTAADPAHDLALVHVDGLDLPPRPLRDEAPVLGEPVWAVGHPFVTAATGALDGLLAWSVSRGVVSAQNEVFVQTDAPVNPGNSGGPLLDDAGAILGIGSRKIAGDGVAFYARTPALAELRASPVPLAVVGGSWGLGVGVLVDGAAAPYAQAWLTVRERLVLRAGAGALLVEAPTPELFGLATLRQRVGRGVYSMTLDAGGGVRFDGSVHPELTGRFAFRHVGFGILVEPASWRWCVSVDLEWPGTVGVF